MQEFKSWLYFFPSLLSTPMLSFLSSGIHSRVTKKKKRLTKDHLRKQWGDEGPFEKRFGCDEVPFEKTFEWRSPNWESVKNVAWKGYFVTTKLKSDNLWRRMKIQTIKMTFVPTSESSLKWKMMNQLKRKVSLPYHLSHLTCIDFLNPDKIAT